jgi:hypothetical protein
VLICQLQPHNKQLRQVNLLYLGWCFKAGSRDTCIAETLANYQYRHYLFLIQKRNAIYLLDNILMRIYTELKKVFGFFNSSFIAQRTNVASV